MSEPNTHSQSRRRTRADEVAESILGLVESGEFPVNSRLPAEKDIADRFGVGRPAVRQALFYLQQQGRVEIRSGARAKVVSQDFDSMNAQIATLVSKLTSTVDGQNQMEQARILFESGVALFAAQNASDEDISRLKLCLDANASSVGDTEAFVKTDLAFHRELMNITQNPVLQALHGVVAAWLIDQGARTIHLPHTEKLSVRDHTEIYDAVAAREPMRAYCAMSTHIKLISELYRETQRITDEAFDGLVDKVNERVTREVEALWDSSDKT